MLSQVGLEVLKILLKADGCDGDVELPGVSRHGKRPGPNFLTLKIFHPSFRGD